MTDIQKQALDIVSDMINNGGNIKLTGESAIILIRAILQDGVKNNDNLSPITFPLSPKKDDPWRSDGPWITYEKHKQPAPSSVSDQITCIYSTNSTSNITKN